MEGGEDLLLLGLPVDEALLVFGEDGGGDLLGEGGVGQLVLHLLDLGADLGQFLLLPGALGLDVDEAGERQEEFTDGIGGDRGALGACQSAAARVRASAFSRPFRMSSSSCGRGAAGRMTKGTRLLEGMLDWARRLRPRVTRSKRAWAEASMTGSMRKYSRSSSSKALGQAA